MPSGLRWVRAITLLLVLVPWACRHHGGTSGGTDAGDTVEAPVPFQVRPGSSDLVFFWFDDRGTAHAANTVADIPVERRAVVRVDPSRPELRAPGTVYLADLRSPGPDGTYPVRGVTVERLSAEIASRMGIGSPGSPTNTHEPGGGSADAGATVARGSQVIIYGASWCGACHQAAAYLRQRHVAFVEKDIEREPGANAEMTAKAQRAGIPVGSIPIIDVHGHLLLGFSAPAIERALAGG